MSNKTHSFFDQIDSLKGWIDRIIEAILIFIVAAMTILVTYQVIVRYFFDSPSAVTEVLSRLTI